MGYSVSLIMMSAKTLISANVVGVCDSWCLFAVVLTGFVVVAGVCVILSFTAVEYVFAIATIQCVTLTVVSLAPYHRPCPCTPTSIQSPLPFSLHSYPHTLPI